MAALCAIAATACAVSCGKTRTTGDGFDETNDGTGGVSVVAGGGTFASGGAAPPEDAPVENACVNGCFAEDDCVEEASGVACTCAASTPTPCDLPFRTLGTLAGEDVCGAQIISNDGSTVAGVCLRSVPNPKPGTNTAVESLSVWRLGEGSPSLTEIGLRPLPSDSSADGTTVVGSWGGGAFRWNAGELEILDDMFVANGVTADGSSIVGTCSSPRGDNYPCTWTEAEGAVPLTTPQGEEDNSSATAVSADGRVIAGYASRDRVWHAVRWNSERAPEWLPTPDDRRPSYVTAISADGATIAGIVTNDQGEWAARWTAEGLELSELGSRPVAVSDDGDRVLLDSRSTPLIWGEGEALLDVLEPVTLAMPLDDWALGPVLDASGDLRVIIGLADYLGSDHPSEWRYSYVIRRP